MSSPHPDELVEVTLDQPRRLFFDLKAIRALDRVMGEVGVQPTLKLLRDFNFEALDRVLWAGLLHEQPYLTVKQVTMQVNAFSSAGGDSTELYIAAYKALNGTRVFGKPEGEAQPEPTTQS